jgi:prevent-host-death family protein
MDYIGLKQFKANIDKVSAQVNEGKHVLVLRRGKPLFKVVPIEEPGWEQIADFTAIKKGGVDIKDILSRL